VADVFLSYKREDRGRAKVIADAVTEHGYSVFYDADIDVGESWNRRIEQEIAAARCVAVLWSDASANVEVGEWVHNEARKGKERKILAPAVIATCPIPIEFSGMQAADLRNCHGDPADPQGREFIERIGVCVAKPPVNLPGRPWRRAWVRWAAGTALAASVAAGGYIAWQITAAKAPATASEPTAVPAAPAARKEPGEDGASSLGYEWRAYVENKNCGMMERWVGDTRAQYPDWDMVATASAQYGRLCDTAPDPALPPPPPPPAPPPPPSSGNLLAALQASSPAPLTASQIAASAQRLGVEPEVVRALIHFQNGSANGFASDGHPVINFESQIFSRQTGGRFDASNPGVSTRTFQSGNYSRPQPQRWAQLTEAYGLDADAALSATAWGRFRILGMNYKPAGFDSLEAFVKAQASSEEAQLKAFEAFLASRKLVEPLSALDWKKFARGFFGSDQFAGQLQQYYEDFKAGRTPR
jgi:hypothetical protein